MTKTYVIKVKVEDNKTGIYDIEKTLFNNVDIQDFDLLEEYDD